MTLEQLKDANTLATRLELLRVQIGRGVHVPNGVRTTVRLEAALRELGVQPGRTVWPLALPARAAA